MSDIVFDNSELVTVLCDNLKIQGHDVLLDSPSRRSPGSTGIRRALVHDQQDGLTINFNKDYPGGVTLNGVRTLEVIGELHFKIANSQRLVTGAFVPAEIANLAEVITVLRQEIAALKAQVTTLSQRP